jgi:hypothetical protein
MQGRPVNAIIAIGVALLVWPALWLLDTMNRGCGDGLCGFFSGLLILGGLAMAATVFVVRSARRDETPGLLRWVPALLWLAAVLPLVR